MGIIVDYFVTESRIFFVKGSFIPKTALLGFLGVTFGLRASALAFRSRANLNIASCRQRVTVLARPETFSYVFEMHTKSPLISVTAGNLAIFRLLLASAR